MPWKRIGVDPTNYPERRMAGASQMIARTSKEGLLETINLILKMELSPLKYRKMFEELFPSLVGFWGSHCRWIGKTMAKPTAPIGSGRICFIIGNIFMSMSLALAREPRDRAYEDRVVEFFILYLKNPIIDL